MMREQQADKAIASHGRLDASSSAKLSQALPDYVASRRWYRAKTRNISSIEVADAIPLNDGRAQLLILAITYADGEADRYILPVSVAAKGRQDYQEVIARLVSESGDETVIYNALEDEGFRNALLNTIICERRTEGREGTLIAWRTAALNERCEAAAGANIESFVSRAEQSNTSIIYRNRYIFKVFRKLEAGVNPDLEIGKFLTERGFQNTPEVLGGLEYWVKRSEEVYAAGILQQFVPNQGDAWKYTLDCLENFFGRVLGSKRSPPAAPAEHVLELMGREIPSELNSFIGPYLESAATLGRRTAEMHAALADPHGPRDFQPEPFTSGDADRLRTELAGQADIAFELLRRKQAVLTGIVAENAHELLRLEHKVMQRFAAVENHPIRALRIRTHGDYHLGQVLYTGRDFMIIDFEGEPARPLAERRAKGLAMRDVAGMLRSFQYAAFAALFGQVPGVPTEPEAARSVEGWAAAWNDCVSATYLRAYFEKAQDLPFVPHGEERRILLDAFLLQKALYELAYELNNRPDWLAIPLRGILSLVS